MSAAKTLWVALWRVALFGGFGGIGVLGLGLMAGAVWYPTGVFWGILIFLFGALGVLLALGNAMTAMNSSSPRSREHPA